MSIDLPFIADIAGVLSFVISGITLLTAVGIRKAVLKNVEKNDYRTQSDAIITKLYSYYVSFKQDSAYGKPLLLELQDFLDELSISYGTILSKQTTAKIKNLHSHIEKRCLSNLSDTKSKDMCCHLINEIKARLKKEKYLL